LGGATSSDLKMLFSHLAGGALSFYLVEKFESLWSAAKSIFKIKFDRKQFSLRNIFGVKYFSILLFLDISNQRLDVYDNVNHRGPPRTAFRNCHKGLEMGVA
jgi:hypothetical protein